VGATVVVITHNAAIAGLADRVVRMRSGTIAAVEHNPKRLTPAEIAW
jgi:putative ABC transport system ATP-binding protein